MRTRDLLWYDVGLLIGTAAAAAVALARRIGHQTPEVPDPDRAPTGRYSMTDPSQAHRHQLATRASPE